MNLKKIASLLLCGVLTISNLVGTPVRLVSAAETEEAVEITEESDETTEADNIEVSEEDTEVSGEATLKVDENSVEVSEENVVEEIKVQPTAKSPKVAGIAINETTFPDERFREYVLEEIDGDGNEELSAEEIADVYEIDIRHSQVESLQGVEFFGNLESLACSYNQLTSLDISSNTKLTSLDCNDNQLTSLDLSSNTNLETLYCHNNQLISLDLSSNTKLTYLGCAYNQLTSLEVDALTDLKILYCHNNQLTSLNVSNSPYLEDLQCNANNLTNIILGNKPELHTLWFNGNQLTNLDVSNAPNLEDLICAANKLTNITLGNKPELEYLWCGVNQLTSLDVSNAPKLASFQCGDNNLTDIVLNNNPELRGLWCDENQLTSLDISNNPKLVTLWCNDNQLTNLDVSNASDLVHLNCKANNLTNITFGNKPELYTLWCSDNQLSNLDVSDKHKLGDLWCNGNQLTSLDVSNLPDLKWFNCAGNKLTNITLGNNKPELESLWCKDNQLTSLDVSKTMLKLIAENTSFVNNAITESEFRNKLPEHLLNETGWLNEQISSQRAHIQDTCVITFNANGGSVSPSSKKVTSGSTYGTLPTPTRAGYTFQGWYTAQTGGTKIASTTKVNITNDQTLYAQWSANKYTVTFDANGGEVTTKNKTVTVGTTYGTLPSGTRTNYTLEGWYTAKTGGTKIEAGTKVNLTTNQTLYAQWGIKTYTIKFNGNKATSGKMDDLKTNHGATKKLTANAFKRTGYKFTGWNTKANGKGIAYKNKASIKNKNLTLYAQWKKNTYTVKFKGNKSTSGKMSNLKMRYGTTKKLKANTFKRTGYTFTGWNTKANGKGTAYKNKASVKNKNLTLYAQWRKKK